MALRQVCHLLQSVPRAITSQQGRRIGYFQMQPCLQGIPTTLRGLHTRGSFASTNSYLCPKLTSILSCNNFQVSSCRWYQEDTETKALTVWGSIKEIKRSPVPALTLGFSGLSLFVVGPAYMMSTGVFDSDIAYAQVAYGACILSFLGGVRWGFTLPEENPVQPDWLNLTYSVLPSLMAWTGLLLPHPFSLLTVMAGLTGAAYFDMIMYGYPVWFKGMRFVLSFVAVLSLWTTCIMGMLMKNSKSKAVKKG